MKRCRRVRNFYPQAVGFTLAEMMVVLAVIAALGALVGIPLTNARRMTRRTLCTANLQKVNQAVSLFATDHAGSLPGPVPGQNGELQWWYKEQVQSYTRTPGASTDTNSVFACPDDRGYTDSRPFYQSQRFDFGSYNFNGVLLPGAPNIAGWAISAVTEPQRTLLTMEWTAHGPLSWHRSRTGQENHPFYCDAESVVALVDGHVDFTKIYFDGYNPAYMRDPLPGYAYRYSGR